MTESDKVGIGCLIGGSLLFLIILGFIGCFYGTIIWAIIHIVHKFF